MTITVAKAPEQDIDPDDSGTPPPEDFEGEGLSNDQGFRRR